MSSFLRNARRKYAEKTAAVPMQGAPPGGDPAMMGMAPPPGGDPAMMAGGMPPPPMDPAAGGMAPMPAGDPAMMGMPPEGGMPPGGDPLAELAALGQGMSPEGAPPAEGQGSPSAEEIRSIVKETLQEVLGDKKDLEHRLDALEEEVSRLRSPGSAEPEKSEMQGFLDDAVEKKETEKAEDGDTEPAEDGLSEEGLSDEALRQRDELTQNLRNYNLR
jgi:hypothetical protein